MDRKIKRLSLDLEGALFVTDGPIVPGEYLPRPHAEQFLYAAERMFDHIFLNTCVDENTARPILKKLFDLNDERWEREGKWSYHNWQSSNEWGPYGKMRGLGKYRGDLLIHIEDSFEKDAEKLDHIEARRCRELGFHYLTISPWHYKLAHSPKAGTDQELLKMITRLETLLAKT